LPQPKRGSGGGSEGSEESTTSSTAEYNKVTYKGPSDWKKDRTTRVVDPTSGLEFLIGEEKDEVPAEVVERITALPGLRFEVAGGNAPAKNKEGDNQ
jgi:hypothetical protein